MPAASLTDSPLRELAHRVSSVAEIRLDAFYHLYAHAASLDVSWYGTPGAA